MVGTSMGELMHSEVSSSVKIWYDGQVSLGLKLVKFNTTQIFQSFLCIRMVQC